MNSAPAVKSKAIGIARHDVDPADDVVDDYETEVSEDGGDDQFITFTATSDITKYRCQPHQAMEGEIQVE